MSATKTLAELYIIIDERANEFELTDKGITSWTKGNQEAEDDFLMLDLGGEYAKIDENPALSEKEKMEKKIALREEDKPPQGALPQFKTAFPRTSSNGKRCRLHRSRPKDCHH